MSNNNKPIFSLPPQSYWIDSTTQSNFPVLNEDIKVDIAIIGGGIVGISTAYLLKKHGISVAILEAGQILQGTTGHTTAKITSQHELIYSKIKQKISEEIAKQYADANESAIKIIKNIANENNIVCDYIPQSAYIYTHKDEYIEKIKAEAEVASTLGIKATYLDEIPLGFPIKAAVRFDNQAQFHPRKFLIPLAEKITSNGCQIFEQSRVVNVEYGSKCTLTTNTGKKVIAEKVIIASHYPCINKPGFYFTRIYPEKSYVIAIKAKEKYPGGMYITAEDPGRSLRSQMSDNGELILVGGEHHKTGQGEDTNTHYEALVDFANKNFTVQDIPYRWSTQDCMTLDGLPYVGYFTSDTPNMYVATGYGKWGMTNSVASAVLLSDLIIKGNSPWKDVYNPSRHTIEASAKNFVVENFNVAKELIEGKISPIPEDIDILPGEAKVVKSEGQRTGVYKDDQGILHIVDTTCTHMGCELQWNSAERSWDCPCHGSRFSPDGEIIEGPTVTPLNVYNNVNTVKRLITEKY